MDIDTVVRALKSNAEVNHHAAVMMMAADLIETLQAQLAEMRKDCDITDAANTALHGALAASQRRAQDARNELCLKCGCYHEAHNGACNGCRWKEN